MRVVTFAAAAIAVLALAGCQSNSAQPTAVLAGSVGVAPTTLAGGLAGNQIGRDLDKSDRQVALQAEYRALEFGRTGASTPWSNGRTGHYGAVIPGVAYRLNDTTCREYSHKIFVDGRSEVANGSACREVDGSWRTVS